MVRAVSGYMSNLDPKAAKLCTIWQAPPGGATHAPTGETAQWYCWPSRYVVDLTYHGPWNLDAKPIAFRGAWLDRSGADAFARSADNGGQPCATVREVPEYWFAPAYGQVTPDDMGDPARELVTMALGWLGGLVRATAAGYDTQKLGYGSGSVEKLRAHAATIDAHELARVDGAIAALRWAERAARVAA